MPALAPSRRPRGAVALARQAPCPRQARRLPACQAAAFDGRAAAQVPKEQHMQGRPTLHPVEPPAGEPVRRR